MEKFFLSQGEILGYDCDKIISVNLTTLKKYFYFFVVSLGYILNGFYVGWSSNFFSFEEQSSNSHHLNRSEISWIISAFPLGVVIVSVFLLKFYYYFGTKMLLLVASSFITLSWVMIIFFGEIFETLFAARLMGGFGSGIIFILVPIYMKELRGVKYSRNIVDLLITMFGLGIFLQYFIDYVTQTSFALVAAALLSFLYLMICCIIPESPHYHAYSELKKNHDLDKTVKINNLWSAKDLERKSIKDVFDELKKLNLFPLIGLILVEQFIGGVSILFYMKHFVSLTGGQFSPELIATTVGLTLIFSISLSKLIRFPKITSTKRQIIFSTVAILLCMVLLAGFCILEGSIGYKIEIIGLNHVPMVVFITVTFFYVVGVSRNCLLIMQQAMTSHSLQLHLRALSIFVTWFFIFAITKILPQLLYLVGVGYFYCYMALITLISLIFLTRVIPSSLNLENAKTTSSEIESNFAESSDSGRNPLTIM